MKLYDEIINDKLLTRKINITANNVVNEATVKETNDYEQMDLFVDYSELEKKRQKEKEERKLQTAMLDIKNKYGKNAIIKGMNLQEGGTTIERNGQIGGHKG